MVNFYILQIQKGSITLEDIPLRWRGLVAEKLEISTNT